MDKSTSFLGKPYHYLLIFVIIPLADFIYKQYFRATLMQFILVVLLPSANSLIRILLVRLPFPLIYFSNGRGPRVQRGKCGKKRETGSWKNSQRSVQTQQLASRVYLVKLLSLHGFFKWVCVLVCSCDVCVGEGEQRAQ